MVINRQNLWIIVLCVLFVVTAGFQYSSSRHGVEQNWKNQIAGCERANKLRAESNARVKSHQADTRGLLMFLNAAAEARAAGRTEADKAAVRNYLDIESMVRDQAVFNKVPLVDCKSAYPKP